MAADSSAPGAEGGSSPGPVPDSPVCLIVLGMAGSGKTTFVQRLTAHLHAQNSPPYVINLDPAVHEVPFPANIGDLVLDEFYASLRVRTGLEQSQTQTQIQTRPRRSGFCFLGPD
uniref:GPN-loop GTPase n=1 Tax=Xiphophorus couchianus TaxID=32473 RepID=A0A3B5LPQ3_9TELE